MERYQKTLAASSVFTGKGLHSGRIVRMEVLPAPADHGIVFQRTDVEAACTVRAHVSNVSSTALSTTIGTGSSSVATIEHLMAAFAGLGIDNAMVRLNGPEVPIMDGSAAPFVRRFLDVGLKVLSADRKVFIVRKPFEVRNGDQFMSVEPASTPRIKCAIDFKRSIIGSQTIDFRPSPENFLKVSDARTFCHVNDVEAMRRQGLALGGSLENAIVVTDTAVMNEGGLRGRNEFVRHKLLDLIGDMFLMGGVLVGEISASRPGHSLHVQFMTELLSRASEYLDVVPAGFLVRGPETAAVEERVEQPVWAYG